MPSPPPAVVLIALRAFRRRRIHVGLAGDVPGEAVPESVATSAPRYGLNRHGKGEECQDRLIGVISY